MLRFLGYQEASKHLTTDNILLRDSDPIWTETLQTLIG